jgi:hypothetical protein
MRIDDFRLPGASIDEMTPQLKILCMFLFDRTRLDRDKYIIFMGNDYWIVGLECINRYCAELGVSRIQNGFHPLYWYKDSCKVCFSNVM